MNSRIRVFSVDDHPLVREGIALVINSQPGMLMVAQASSGREAIERFREHKPDVTLMDLRLPDMSVIDAMIAIQKEFPEARVIILTTFDSGAEYVQALGTAACASMLKSLRLTVLAEILRQAHACRCSGYSLLSFHYLPSTSL